MTFLRLGKRNEVFMAKLIGSDATKKKTIKNQRSLYEYFKSVMEGESS